MGEDPISRADLDISAKVFDRLLRGWKSGKEFQTQLEVQLAEEQRLPERDGDMSLLLSPSGELEFVYWKEVRTRIAHPVRLDGLDRIKTIVACNPVFKERAYRVPPNEIIIPRTGGISIRSWGDASRPTMPLLALQVRMKYELDRFNGPFTPASLPQRFLPRAAQPLETEAAALEHPFQQPFCSLCVACEECGVDQASETLDKSLWVCRGCLSVWHNTCARSIFCIDRGSLSRCRRNHGSELPLLLVGWLRA